MRRSRWPFVVTMAVLLFLYLPIIILIVNSFNASRFETGWQGFSLIWYERLFQEPEIWRAAKNSLVIAASATALSLIIGTTAAVALHRFARSRLQGVHFGLVYMPLVVPEILMGISLLMVFVAVGIQLGLFTIFLAHVTFCTSFVAMTVLARLQDFDPSVIEAARDLGAGWGTTIRRILLPLLLPGLVAGGLLAFTLSIDDFVITFFVAGPGSTTLPIRVYSMIKFGSPPLINALSTILLVITFAAVAISQRVSRSRS
ncbi:MAG: ABC transporter permease subunit [Candidatus Aminicenantes bacterium]|nr:ABC transporter permease subunit [Candidatus Aminicenantes bacterium]